MNESDTNTGQDKGVSQVYIFQIQLEIMAAIGDFDAINSAQHCALNANVASFFPVSHSLNSSNRANLKS